MSGAARGSDDLARLIAKARGTDPRLSTIQACLIVAFNHSIANDSRTFARLFEVPHAVVLRELVDLAEAHGRLLVTRRDSRTMRTYYTVVEGA